MTQPTTPLSILLAVAASACAAPSASTFDSEPGATDEDLAAFCAAEGCDLDELLADADRADGARPIRQWVTDASHIRATGGLLRCGSEGVHPTATVSEVVDLIYTADWSSWWTGSASHDPVPAQVTMDTPSRTFGFYPNAIFGWGPIHLTMTVRHPDLTMVDGEVVSARISFRLDGDLSGEAEWRIVRTDDGVSIVAQWLDVKVHKFGGRLPVTVERLHLLTEGRGFRGMLKKLDQVVSTRPTGTRAAIANEEPSSDDASNENAGL